jgi:hypothetical protein
VLGEDLDVPRFASDKMIQLRPERSGPGGGGGDGIWIHNRRAAVEAPVRSRSHKMGHDEYSACPL